MAFYVTTPIYYVNAAPHLGHAYTTIGADILARHMRQRGEDVFFLTGTDEHGEPVAQAAEREGVTPKELADRNAARFQDLMPRINASIDFFIRTSDPRHGKRVQEVMQRIYDNGHVYKGMYEGWYCPRCADFKTDAEIGPDNTCPIHRIPLDREREENWFFRLSSFQEQLEQLYDGQSDFVLPRVRFNEARSFIAGGLQDVSLSRAKLDWGVPVPWDPEHVFYVWFDALLNYYTALSFAHDGAGRDRRLLARRLPRHRQGHPQVPRGLLAGDAARRRHPAARAPLHPRLPADEGRVGRGAQDVQVAGQRARPVRGHGPVRDRRAPLLLLPRGLLRARRLRLDDHVRRALHVRARQRVRQPRQPHAEHDRPLLRRRGAGRRRRPGAARRLRRARRRGVRAARPRRDHAGARPHLGARAAAQPLRRGEGAVEARQGPRRRGRAADHAALARRGPAHADRAALALHARVDRQAARRARRRADRAERRRVRRGPRRRARSASCRHCSRSRSDRLAHPPRPRPRARGRAGGRGAPGGRQPDPHDRDGLGGLPRGARRRGALRRGLRRRRPPPELGARLRRRRRGGARRARAGAALPRGRGDRARLLPRPRAARGPGARVPRPDRGRPRGRQAARHPHARGRRRHRRHARDPRPGRRGRHALLLDARPARRVPRARLVDLVRRQRHLPEVDRARRRRRARPARPPARRDRRALPDAAGGAQAPQPERVRRLHRGVHRRAPRASTTGSSSRRSRPTPRACSAGERAPGAAQPAPHEGVRDPPQPRPGAELPDRLEPARRDRPRRPS